MKDPTHPPSGSRRAEPQPASPPPPGGSPPHWLTPQLEVRIAALESMASALVDGFVVTDEQGRFLLYNPAAERILRMARPDLGYEEWTRHYGLFRPDRQTLFDVDDLPLVRAIRGETVRQELIFMRHAEAPEGVWLSVNANPFRDDAGVIRGGIAVFRDVTVQKNMEAELVEAKERAEAGGRAKSVFLATMSHEIRTPLNSILGFADLIIAAESLEQQRQYGIIIKEAGQILLSLVEDVLDFSSMEAGRLPSEPVGFRLRALVSDTLRLLSVGDTRRRLRITAGIDPDVPDQLFGEARRVRQILHNLVGNAIKFTERGEISVGVRVVSGNEHGTELRFSVQDTGIGIPREKQRSIFESFEQADSSTRRKYGGSGLGLSIASRLVDSMGGTLQVESEPGNGSTFWFDLRFEFGSAEDLRPAPDPVLPVGSEAVPEAPEAVPRPRGRRQTSRPRRILLAEDSHTNQMLAGLILERWGHKVDFAKNGEEAVSAFFQERPDVVLMDVEMPGMDGFEAVRRIREQEGQEARVPIIALTAHALDWQRSRCLEAGMSDFLAKPLDPEELFDLLESLP